MESDDLKLDEGLKLAQMVERAEEEARTVGNRQTRGDTDAVNLLRRGHAWSSLRVQRDSGGCSPAQTANHRVSEGCPNFGGSHDFKCGKRNHFAAVCRSSSDAATSRYPHFAGNGSKRTETSTCINVIYRISRPRCELHKSTVRIGGRQIRLFMDLGAHVSVLHFSVVTALRCMTEIRATSKNNCKPTAVRRSSSLAQFVSLCHTTTSHCQRSSSLS